MSDLTRCALWKDPEAVIADKMADRFELLDTIEDGSHHWRYLLKCRQCGQRYVFEFYEEIDWEDGDDPSWCTYVPVETEDEIAKLKTCWPGLLFLDGRPSLKDDRPKGKPRKLGWVGRGLVAGTA